MTDLAPPPQAVIDAIVRRAFTEDFGDRGDVTTDSIVPVEAVARGTVVAREAGVVAGITVGARAFTLLDPTVAITFDCADGDEVSEGEALIRLQGSAVTLLSAERTALNFVGHLSGIATATRRLVQAVDGTGVSIVDTRKTTPGLRALEKFAVRCGGGRNHRFGLHDAVLIKDNHIAVAGGVTAAVHAARAGAGHTLNVEVEVDTFDQLQEALEAGADIVLLDNMTPEALAKAVRLVDGRAVTEASGGIDLAGVRSVAEAGVDLISSGALTHSAPRLDVSMQLEAFEEGTSHGTGPEGGAGR